MEIRRSESSGAPTFLGLKVFVTVARCESITRAAEELSYLNLSSLIHHIKSLEQLYGTELFFHGRKRMELTDSGRVLYPAAAEIVERVDELEAAMATCRGENERLAFGGSVPLLPFLRAVYKCIRVERPLLQLQLTHYWESKDVETALLRGEIDTGFLSQPPSRTGNRLEFVALKEKMVVVAAAKPPLCDGSWIGKEELSQQMILVPKSNPDACAVHARAVKALGATFRFSEDSPSLQVTVEKVTIGHGVALMPESTARESFENGSVQILRVREADPHRDIFAVHLRGRPNSRWYKELSHVAQRVLAS